MNKLTRREFIETKYTEKKNTERKRESRILTISQICKKEEKDNKNELN